MKKLFVITMAIAQLIFFLSCFKIAFINTDTESSYAGHSMYDCLTYYIDPVNIILLGIMAIGIFAPIIVILLLSKVNSQKKYIYCSILVLISILSFLNFYSRNKGFLYVLKLSYSFYTLAGSLLVSVFCILGIFIINIKLKYRNYTSVT